MKTSAVQEKRDVGAVLKDFCDNTSVHGMRCVVRSGPVWLTLAWAAVVIFAFSGLCFQVHWIIYNYTQYKTVVNNYHKPYYYFPDVTICSENGISMSNMRAVAKESKEVQCLLDLITNSEIESKTDNCTLNYIPQISTVFHALGKEVSRKIGHQFVDMILDCRYKGMPCSQKDFELHQFSRYLNCYIFVKDRYKRTLRGGSDSGLSLILYSEQSDYKIPYSNGGINDNLDGFHVALVPQKTSPTVGTFGWGIPLGTAVAVSFKAEAYRRLPEPYSKCVPVYWHKEHVYSFQECINKCACQRVVEACGCLPTTTQVRRNHSESETPSCASELFTNNTKTIKMLYCESITEQNGSDCNCHVPCHEETYPLSASESSWPAQRSIDSFPNYIFEHHYKKDNLKAYKHFQTLKAQNASKNRIHHWIRNHFVRLNVFSSTRYRSFKAEVPMYTATDLLCNIGGCLGLWMGISLVTSAEIIQVLFKLLQASAKKLKDTNRVTRIKVNESFEK